MNGKFSQICQKDLIGLKLSRFVKEEDLDSFLDDYLKGIILPKIIGLSGPLGAGKTTVAKKIIKFLKKLNFFIKKEKISLKLKL